MSGKVYGLKRATGLMKIHHMNMMMEFKRDLVRAQDIESERKHRAGMEDTQNLRDLMTQDEYNEWWEAAPEHGFFDAVRALLAQLQTVRPDDQYKWARLPSPCPKCGGVLNVRQRHMRVRNAPDRIDYFVGCANFETTGCRHTQPLTAMVKLSIDAMPRVDTDLGI